MIGDKCFEKTHNITYYHNFTLASWCNIEPVKIKIKFAQLWCTSSSTYSEIRAAIFEMNRYSLPIMRSVHVLSAENE
jgi:hypothetical protein